MPEKTSNQTRIRILKISIIILAGCVVLLFLYTSRFSNKTPPVKLANNLKTADVPARIKILGINVDAAVEQVAVTADGYMDVPKHPLDVAWYKLGPRPGEIGSAVIAGHKDWKNGERAVFADLHKLKPGDNITVQNDQGAVISFIVRKIQTYNPSAEATDVFASTDGKAHLNLITCKGVWNKVTEDYSQRLVVFTDKIE